VNTDLRRAAVIGAGIMGHGIAQALAENGLGVALVDTSEERLEAARGWIEDNLRYMVELALLDPVGEEEVLDRITCTTDLPGAVRGAEYVLEAVSEDFRLKREVWSALSAASAPEALLASNTSSFDMDELTRGVSHPERVMGTHWFHPPQITPCVEVIPAATTGEAHIDRMMRFLSGLGKVPTRCRNAPGFVANRIQFAMVREAIALVEEGLATPREVDRIVKSSFGFRLGAYGPFEIIDQAGADTYLSVYSYLFAKLGKEHFRPPRLLEEQVARGRLGLKSRGGFYEYGAEAADATRRDRDRKLYARLSLARRERDRGAVTGSSESASTEPRP